MSLQSLHVHALTMIALLLLGFEFVRGAKVEVQPEDQAIAAVTPMISP